MFSTSLKTALAASSLLLLSLVHANPTPIANPDPSPIAQDIPKATYTGPLNTLTNVGCFSTAQPMSDHGNYTFQSKGNCQPICYQLQMPVMGLVNGTNCWCGPLMPPNNTQVDTSQCNTPCAGIDTEFCMFGLRDEPL
jgi:cell wall integrity and stress response component